MTPNGLKIGEGGILVEIPKRRPDFKYKKKYQSETLPAALAKPLVGGSAF